MDDDGPMRRAGENASGIAALVVTGTWLAAMMAGFDWWLPLLLFGYIVVVPLVGMLFDDEADEDDWWEREAHGPQRERPSDEPDEADDADDALETLRNRYARGELTEEQFERKVERLLETDTLENVEDRHRDRTRGPGGERDRDRVSETE